MESVEDLRVVRGPDWEHGEEDGGEGHLGTVVEVHRATQAEEATTADDSGPQDANSINGGGDAVESQEVDRTRSAGVGEVHSVAVQWDCGHRGAYKCGKDGKFELRVFDSAQTGRQSRRVNCDGCRVSPLLGIRWKCSQCYDYDLCSSCYMSNKHSEGHRFVRYDTEQLRTMVPYRRGCRVVDAKGIFPQAEVVRGHDWSWGQQDGGSGSVGKVTTISNWEDTHYRASVEVEWPEEGKMSCRVGCQGMVDLKCVSPASGGNYYPDHLQVLGAPHCPADPCEFASSDYVRVELDAEIFEILQESHGGWNSDMANLRGELGVVHSILDNGDLRVSYGARDWIINPSAVVKADVPRYKPGDVVRVMDDLAEVTKLQKNHGGWNDEMSESIGQLGSVQGVSNDGNVAVLMKTHIWTFNPLSLRPAEKGEEQGVSSSEILGEETQLLEMRMQVLMEQEDSELLHHASLLGNITVIIEYLDKYPNEVDAKFSGKTALHCAVAAGKMNVVEALIELGANLECEDEVGYRPLHHCANREQPEIASVLLKAGSEPNSKSHIDQTPLIIAASRGHMRVLNVLLRWPTIRLSEQDKDGDTALHCSVHGRKYQSLCALLEAGADPSLVNFGISTPLHLAVKVGFLPAVESILKVHPEHVNVREQLGCTPLHLAATEGEFEVAKTLLEIPDCLLDARAETGHTPLHGAVMKDHSRLVELLIGHGADPTITDGDGSTILHLALDNDDLQPPSEATPELNKVKDLVMEMTDVVTGQLVVVCFLVREGADITALNDSGQTPLDACSPEMAVVVSTFAGRHAGSGKYRGSLRNPPQPEMNDVQEENNSGSTQPVSNGAPEVSLDEKGGGESNLPLQSAANHSPVADTTTTTTGNKADPIPTTAGAPELCFLCDVPITVRFEPCGHSTLCANCANRARKCPECRTPVQAVSELQV